MGKRTRVRFFEMIKVSFGEDSGEQDRDRSCRGKIRYGRHSSAALSAATQKVMKGRVLEPYYCCYCDGWHLGHRMGWFMRWLIKLARGNDSDLEAS